MRLIDADALVSALNNGRLKEQTGRAVPFNAGVAFALTMVEYAPTVDAMPRWIPCEERLPEIGEGFCSKDVIVALDDGGIAFTCLEATLFGSVCWQIERMNEIEDGKEINVIAWMPLPEPYEGERKDND